MITSHRQPLLLPFFPLSFCLINFSFSAITPPPSSNSQQPSKDSRQHDKSADPDATARRASANLDRRGSASTSSRSGRSRLRRRRGGRVGSDDGLGARGAGAARRARGVDGDLDGLDEVGARDARLVGVVHDDGSVGEEGALAFDQGGVQFGIAGDGVILVSLGSKALKW